MRDLDQRIWSHELVSTAEQSARLFLKNLEKRSPNLIRHVHGWLALRMNMERLQDYFLHPQSLPILSLPWWSRKALILK